MKKVESTGANMFDPKKVIAVVDDDPGIRKALARLLRGAGFEAHAFGTAEEFLRSEESGSDFCLLLDIRLPGMSGLELYASLASHGIRLPVVFMAADEQNRLRAAALLGERLCLWKPFSDAALLGAIREATADA
jgi:FixJ family two-component response regulator